MARPANTLALRPPKPDLEMGLARRIHNARSALTEEILDHLAGCPLRYADLQPLLRGRHTNVLNKALKMLAQEGLIDQSGDPDEPGLTRYQLTRLGVAVRDAIVELRFAERVHAMAEGEPGSAPR